VGICESHAVAFAAGQAKVGCRPIVDIYSTFLQRSYDQIFQEVSLQNLPVLFMLDRAGLTGPDGPTHHGSYDLGYMRLFPNMTVMAPGDEHDLEEMVPWALSHDGPAAIRYPKAARVRLDFPRQPMALGKAEQACEGRDGLVIACGTLLSEALAAVSHLRSEGLDVAVINARFVKPLDTELIFDFDPSGKEIGGLRAVVNGEEVRSTEDALPTDGKYHHFAMTYDDGRIGLYYDGRRIGEGEVRPGLVLLGNNLRFGEDLGGGANEQLRGNADDILIVKRAYAFLV